MIYDLKLSHSAIAVYSYLLRREDRKTYQCLLSYREIGDGVGMCVTTVRKYVAELDANPEALAFAKKLSSPEMAKYPRVTLIYAARDEKENEAVVLQKWLPAHE